MCCCGCAFLQVELQVKASLWFGKGAASIIVTADVDVPDKVLEKRIHLAEVRNESSEMKWEKAYRSDVGSAAATGTCDCAVKISFGRVECREFARTVGDNEVVGPVPLCLDWEVLSVVVASVTSTRTFGLRCLRTERRTFSLPLPRNGLLCWKSAA
jgi:hypothetical protein